MARDMICFEMNLNYWQLNRGEVLCGAKGENEGVKVL
jgi:hypothetical protein